MNDQLVYVKPDELALEEIPIIDFEPFRTGSFSDQRDVAKQIQSACRSIGFFYIINHGVPRSLRESVLDEARTFFNRPLSEKMKSAPLLDGQWCGYLPARGAAEGTLPGGSLVPGENKSKVSGGTLEQFNMMRVLDAEDPNFGSADLVYQRNLWPEAQPRFVETMIVNQRALRKLSVQLMDAFSMAIGVERDFLAKFHQSPLATFGLNYYSAPNNPNSDVGVGAHCDASSFTILLQDDVGGLEVKEVSGRWIAAPVIPDAYIINIGDTLMGWTNGYFVSTLHRVVSRKAVDRFSATMFVNPDRDVVVAPLDHFVTPESPRRYEPFLNDDYMRRFFVKFYDSMFKLDES